MTVDEAGDFADFDGYSTEAVDSVDVGSPEPDDGEGQLGDGSAQAQAPRTGNEQVDAATARLDELNEKPTPEHAELFEDVHRRLQGALADLDGS